MRIVEEYQSKDEAERQVEEIIRLTEESFSRKSALSGISEKPGLSDIANSRMLVLDGAMGTMIQQYQLREEDFRGARFANHPNELKGCNDVLSLTSPFIIREIHSKYLEAGADIIETNTFNAQRISMGDYGMQDYCREINLAAARLARQCADEFSTSDKPRYVAGSIGPTSRTIISEKLKDKSDNLATALREAYAEQIKALVDGGVDSLLIETIFDVENAQIAIEEARRIAPDMPLMLSFSVSTPDGHNMLGQSIVDFLEKQSTTFFSIGINCLSNVAQMTPLIYKLAAFGTRVSLYPNAGMPDGNGHYSKTPEGLLADLWPLLENHRLNIVGGCCGTTDAHIRMIAQAIEPIPGIRLSPLDPERKDRLEMPKTAEVPMTPGNPVIPKNPTASPAERLYEAILTGKSDEAAAATKDAIADGIAPQELINGQMIRAMGEVGQRFQDGQAFVPQLLMAGRAMKAALELLKPMLAGAASTSLGKVVIGTVKGDLHDIGKNLVASMLEGCGFEVVNIGIDVSADKFIEAVKENQPDILCMSALLTTTMGYMKDVIDALEKAGIRQQVKVMVGGAPVTQGFADEIGADGYSDNANSAVTVAKQLLKLR